MIEIIGLDHIVLRTQNLDLMLRFYQETLGCPIERETTFGLTQLRAGNALIDLVEVDSNLGRLGGGAPTSKDNNMDHFCLQIKAAAEQLIIDHLNQQPTFGQGLGDGLNEGFAERYGATGLGRSIYIKDPDGNTVELRPIS
ncbi:MAG: VOC family protein [Pseudomonadales bacterium]|nr:VOC family protein [Pseudomonadales bacterium]MDG1443833.1 VOC family protein [Pseudomonadales bacterium]